MAKSKKVLMLLILFTATKEVRLKSMLPSRKKTQYPLIVLPLLLTEAGSLLNIVTNVADPKS
jgi:hypothetical protein